MNNKTETFVEKLYECNQHKQKLLISSKRLESLMPMSVDRYNALSAEESSFVDQMIFRFSKLQDTMGEKLFPALLEIMGEEVKSKPFIDRLNRIEELGLVYKNEWMDLRKDRNEIAHEYSFNKDEVVDGINTIYNALNKLLSIYDTFYNYCLNKFEFVNNVDILKKM
jgi:hypothetical protein